MENEDWKKLGDGIWTVAECVDLANADVFCGQMIMMEHENSLRCFCRGLGKENTCSPTSGSRDGSKRQYDYWNIYSLNPGKSKFDAAQ